MFSLSWDAPPENLEESSGERGEEGRKNGCTLAQQILWPHIHRLFPGCNLNVKAEMDCRSIHCASRDLATLQRIFGRLAGHFIGETHFQSRFNDGLSVVKRYLRTAWPCNWVFKASLFVISSSENQFLLFIDIFYFYNQPVTINN